MQGVYVNGLPLAQASIHEEFDREFLADYRAAMRGYSNL